MVQTLRELANAFVGTTPSFKRTCIRLLDDGGEQADTFADKGTYKFLVDLDGRRHPTRNKRPSGALFHV